MATNRKYVNKSEDTQVHTTNDYKKFVLMVDNRRTAKNHINKLVAAIQANPRILKVQPILVNENMEIIDGQHRFQAAKELGLPIHYTMVEGLDIGTAREMNAMQRKWTVDDYAHSYATAGNVHYKAFNAYRRDFPSITGSILMLILAGTEGSKMSHDFRFGKFTVNLDKDDAEWQLEQLRKIQEITGGEIPINKSFATALLIHALKRDDFKMEEFIEKLQRKPDLFRRTSTLRDALRMIEDIYNFHRSTNLIRLY